MNETTMVSDYHHFKKDFSLQSLSFDFLNNPAEDIYDENDGEELREG